MNQILQHALLSAFPNDAWLSEESPDDSLRLQTERVWILDPIDGTKPFIKNLPHYTISLALIDKGEPAHWCDLQSRHTMNSSLLFRGSNQPSIGQPIHVRAFTKPSSQKTFLVNSWHVDETTMKTWESEHRCPPLHGIHSLFFSTRGCRTGRRRDQYWSTK